MSDPKQTLADKERAKLLDTRDKTDIEPIPKSPALFEWLEKLFDGGSQFPEMISCRVVTGRNYERLGASIKQIIFPPKATKPSRGELVALSNELVGLMQRDADIQRKRVVYGMHVSHKMRDPDFYERYLYPCNPSPLHAGEGVPRPEEDDSPADRTIEAQFAVQAMGHQERMFALYGGGFEGLLDRMDRINEQQAQAILKKDERIEKLTDMLERALSHEEERREKREWSLLKIRSVEKAVELGLAIAPPLLNQIAGKKLIETSDSQEALTLRNFFKKKSEGGLLTEEQAVLAFGSDDGKPGVLAYDQIKLLFDVAHCRAPAEELDKLLPGGPLEITNEQVAALTMRCGFTVEQLVPLHLTFEARMKRRQGN